MDLLVSQGIDMAHSYVFYCCSPTRSSLQSGRNPIHEPCVISHHAQRRDTELITSCNFGGIGWIVLDYLLQFRGHWMDST